MRRLAYAGLALAGTICASRADAATWSSGGIFLPLGHGARSHGMGGAGVTLLRDDTAVYWNPANLSWNERRSGLTVMVAEIFPGVGDGYQTLGYGRRAGAVLGDSLQSVRTGKWGYGLFYSHLGLDFDSGLWSENTIRLAGAWGFCNYASLGIATKIDWLQNDFTKGGASGFGIDLGLSALFTDHVFVALVARDVFSRVRFDNETTQDQEAQLDLGLEYLASRSWSVLGEVTSRDDLLSRTRVAVEWRERREILALRAAYTLLAGGDSRAYPSAGFGVRWERFQLDYGVSFEGDDAMGTKQRLSLQVRL
jgi:hypothetical protein